MAFAHNSTTRGTSVPSRWSCSPRSTPNVAPVEAGIPGTAYCSERMDAGFPELPLEAMGMPFPGEECEVDEECCWEGASSDFWTWVGMGGSYSVSLTSPKDSISGNLMNRDLRIPPHMAHPVLVLLVFPSPRHNSACTI